MPAGMSVPTPTVVAHEQCRATTLSPRRPHAASYAQTPRIRQRERSAASAWPTSDLGDFSTTFGDQLGHRVVVVGPLRPAAARYPGRSASNFVDDNFSTVLWVVPQSIGGGPVGPELVDRQK